MRVKKTPVPSPPTAATAPAWPISRSTAALLLIVLLGAGLRLYAIGESSFWVDEFCSVECATGRDLAHVELPAGVWIDNPPHLTSLEGARPWWSIWTHMRLDNHPPLYFILLRWWMMLGWTSDAQLRALSILPGLAAIGLLYDAVRTLHGKRAGLWAALLLALGNPAIHFSQETRNYSLLLAMGLMSCAAMARISRHGPSAGRATALIAGVVGMLLSHYFAIAGLAALGLYALLALRGKARWWTIGALSAATGVFLLVWGPFLWQQHRSVGINNMWQIEPAADHLSQTFWRLADLPVRFLKDFFPETLSDPYWRSVLGALGLTAYLLPLCWLRRRRALLLWYLWFLCPVLMVFGLDLIRHAKHLLFIRYTILAAPGLYALLAVASNRKPRWLGDAIPGAASLLCLVGLFRGTYGDNIEWPTLADYLESHATPRDVIVYASAGRDDQYAGAMYLGVSYYAPELKTPIFLLTRPATPEQLTRLSRASTVWLLAGKPTIPYEMLLPGFRLHEDAIFPLVGRLWRLSPPSASAEPSPASGP